MRFNRLENMIGPKNMSKLSSVKIIVFGLGGVGSFTAEALARCGIINLTVIDYDIVDITNINRQLIALDSTVGLKKTEVFKKRAIDINPMIKIKALDIRVTKENIESILFDRYDYVIDCIDDVEAKIAIISTANKHKTKLISSMGFANKSKPEMIKITKMNQTKTCPLAKSLRKKLKLRGCSLDFEVVYSEEEPIITLNRNVLGSNSYTPSCAGLIIASRVINNLLEGE